MSEDYLVRDIGLAEEGERQIEWVSRRMPVLNGLREKFERTGEFRNKRVALCIHLEAKTAHLALSIKKLGADVWITGSNPLSTKDEVAAALAKHGVHVYAKHAASREEYFSFIHSILRDGMDAAVDDGGDICEYLHEHPEYGQNMLGICEETTTGVNRLRALEATGRLRYPAVAVNDAGSKHLFDNRYGTGQSTWTAITHLTNMNVAGKTVVVVGYGWVGKGVAARAAGLGAEVIVTEIDPWKALEARMDGYRVMRMTDAAPLGDFFVTTTGAESVIRFDHMEKMKDGAFLANAGHFDFEIDIQTLKKNSVSAARVRDEIDEYMLWNQKRLYLLASGGIVNIAGGLGHPADIMDMSFSVQLSCLHHFLSSPKLEPKIYPVPVEIDRIVVEEKLKAEGISIDK
ncbi:MAG: adenosylhomocysteinase [Bacteroidetes bacterium]|jgi:adenosylhomocysteinase|nr:adenosylhomocysteinase [Bacteroidota bacterium]